MTSHRPVTSLWQSRCRLASLLLALVALVLATPPAAAQAPGHIAAELLAEGPAAPGATVTLAIHMRPAPGWHGYWLNPGDAGYPMRLAWRLPAGAAAGEPDWPVPQTLLLAGLMNHAYESDYAALVPLTLPAGAKPGAALPIAADAEWLACSQSVCVPEKAHLATTVQVAAAGAPPMHSARFDGWRTRLPAPLGGEAHFALTASTIRLAVPLPAGLALGEPHLFPIADRVADYAAPQSFARAGDTLLVTVPRAKFAAVTPSTLAAVLRLDQAGDGVAFTATPGPVPTGGVPLAGASPKLPAPLPLLLLAALAGGLLLNVMPCVFPILSLKALSLARAGESAASARAEGLAYSAGVIVACVALGGLLLALRAGGEQIGWAFQLQQPGVVAALLLLAVGITANLLGLYELAIPGFAQNHETRGAFATGLLAAFVATPCTGPFMASAMGAALLLPTGAALALFATLGLGIALPFLAIAFVPVLRRALPRPGAWLAWFRRAMAVPMALTALALAWLASRLGGWSFAGAAMVIALVLIALLAMLGDAQRRGEAGGRRFAVLLSVLLAASALILPHAIRAPQAEGADLLPAQPWSEQALARAHAAGHPVFAFFTADWCLTCKVNERLAIERESTRDAFARAGVVVLKGDWTRRDAEITRTLTAHGAAGVPLYLWAPATGDARVLPQVLTPELLADLAHNPG